MTVFYNAAQITWQVRYSIAFSKQLEVFVYLQEYGLIRVVRMLMHVARYSVICRVTHYRDLIEGAILLGETYITKE